MQHRIVHGLSLALARVVTREALQSYRDRYPEFKPAGEWSSPDHATFALHMLGATLEGEAVVDGEAVTLTFRVPVILLPWKQRVTGMIDEEMALWLQWAREGRFDALV